MKWITRERPKIDRIACPWLIRRFIDKNAEIIYVPFDQVISKAKELNATPFDIPDVEFTHYGDECTFDYFIRKFELKDPTLKTISIIVRGADTDRHDMANQASGLWAISAGLSYNYKNDHELLEKGMMIYDALYSWSKHLQNEKHTQNPVEHLLLDVYQKFLKQKSGSKKIPRWAQELKEIIQDQIDTNLSLNLKAVSQSLNVHPTYLSREFSRYFEDLSFGDYIRKLRIEKAIQLLNDSTCTLSEIAYLTGFSDQSHFSRIFKRHMGKNPSAYKKILSKGKSDTKGK
jgi:AraC-like DNA-binding protein